MMLLHCKRTLLHIVFPILCGVSVYALWRGIYIFDIPPLLVSRPLDWIKFNLPDGLWFYSLLSSIMLIWQENSYRHFIPWLLLAIIMGISLEISQAYNFTSGTFDWNDLIAYSIATIFFFFNFQQSFKIKKK